MFDHFVPDGIRVLMGRFLFCKYLELKTAANGIVSFLQALKLGGWAKAIDHMQLSCLSLGPHAPESKLLN